MIPSRGVRRCDDVFAEHGARKVGEPHGLAYFNIDDVVLVDAAAADPIGFVDDLP
jgi:hypothetical protein